jgi:hypothetical protein
MPTDNQQATTTDRNKLQVSDTGIKSLRNMTKQIHQWLANIRAEMINFRSEMMQELKTFTDKDQEKPIIQTSLDFADDAIEAIDKLYTALKTLSAAPPGVGSALIDFLYQTFSNKGNAPTEKAKFNEQMNRVNEHIMRLRLREESSIMGLKEHELESTIDSIVTDLNVPTAVQREILALTQEVLKDNPSTPLVQDYIRNINAILIKDNATTASARLTTLVSTLKSRLEDRINNAPVSDKSKSQKLVHLTIIPDKVTAKSYKAMMKWSTNHYKQFVDNLKEWDDLLMQRREQAKSHLSQLQQQAAQLAGKVNKQEIPLIRKYVKFFETVLGPHNPSSIVSIQLKLSSQLNKIIEDKTKQQDSPKQEDPSKQKTSPIDSPRNDRDTLSKNPESTQEQGKSSEDQDKT